MTQNRLFGWLKSVISGEERERGGFQDWIRNPGWRKSLAQKHQEFDRKPLPKNVTDRHVRRYVNDLMDPAEASFSHQRLEMLGERAVPFLVDAFHDDRFAGFESYDDGFGPFVPLDRLTDVLADFAGETCVQRSIELISRDGKLSRRYAALILGATGSVTGLPILKNLLEEQDRYISEYVCLGVLKANKAQRLSPELRTSVFQTLVSLMVNGQWLNDKLLVAMFHLNEEKTMELVLQPSWFRFDNQYFRETCQFLLEMAAHVHPSKIKTQIRECQKAMIWKEPSEHPGKARVKRKPGQSKYLAFRREFEMLLMLYAANPDEQAEPYLRKLLEKKAKEVFEPAAEALVAMNKLWYWDNDDEKRPLNQYQKMCMAVHMMDSEVMNGGFSQYFVNSSGDEWKLARQGLAQIGAANALSILKRTLPTFGRSGPSTDHDGRHEQLANMSDLYREILDDLDTEYYRSSEKESVIHLINMFMIGHSEHFR